MDKERIREALRALPIQSVANDAFFEVGKVLKKEGLTWKEWDEWAKDDERWRPWLCLPYWETFDPQECGLDGNYIVRLAELCGRLEPRTAPTDGERDGKEEQADTLSEQAALEDALYAEAAAEDLRRAEEWEREQNETDYDGLPCSVTLSDYRDAPPALPEPLIGGILRQGHKMMLSGGSKSGKSFLLMELCVAIAEGRPWLGFPCRRGRVMYVNLEIDPSSAIRRFLGIYGALGIEAPHMENVEIWNLRGAAMPMDRLAWPLVRRLREKRYDAVIIDPIYKVLTGDENSAAEMAAFCNQFDRVCAKTGCSVITCHHHSKGAQGGRKTEDRASGSGVFARDPDALLDLIELELSPEQKKKAPEGATAWRLESRLREFADVKPVHFWYRYPLHLTDTEGVLDNAVPDEGKRKRTNAASRTALLTEAFAACERDGEATVGGLARQAEVSRRTMQDWLHENATLYRVTNDRVTRR